MQLGVRWRSGEAPHRSVPAALHAEIARQEALFPSAGHWTLTWLEGRPRAVLDHLVRVQLTAAGDIEVQPLRTETGAAGANRAAAEYDGIVDGSIDNDDDDDDDDWLK